MRRLLLRWLAPLLVAGACALPYAQAQNQTDSVRANYNNTGGQPAQTDETQAPVFSYFIAICATLLIVFTIVRPSRKQL